MCLYEHRNVTLAASLEDIHDLGFRVYGLGYRLYVCSLTSLILLSLSKDTVIESVWCTGSASIFGPSEGYP